MPGGWINFAAAHGIAPIRISCDVVFKVIDDGVVVIKPKNETGELGVIRNLDFIYMADE